MSAVFLVLVLLALSIKAITLLDRESVTLAESNPVSDSVDRDLDSVNSDAITGQQVAAMAVAIALADSGFAPTQLMTHVHGTSSPDAWLQSGRARLMTTSGSFFGVRRI
mgnify:FL=1|tara:strand:+ start:2680 stop:3006 length:327 start_codon:yes stop_codon:yes gene_type:complete